MSKAVSSPEQSESAEPGDEGEETEEDGSQGETEQESESETDTGAGEADDQGEPRPEAGEGTEPGDPKEGGSEQGEPGENEKAVGEEPIDPDDVIDEKTGYSKRQARELLEAMADEQEDLGLLRRRRMVAPSRRYRDW